eukprot:7086996-Alexandrium_andersonii.AAC.1
MGGTSWPCGLAFWAAPRWAPSRATPCRPTPAPTPCRATPPTSGAPSRTPRKAPCGPPAMST